MQETIVSTHLTEGRAAFVHAVERSGLTFSAEEAESVATLAEWMRNGLAAIAEPDVSAQASDADAVLDLTLFEQGAMLRDGRLSSSALIEAALRRIEERDATYRP